MGFEIPSRSSLPMTSSLHLPPPPNPSQRPTNRRDIRTLINIGIYIKADKKLRESNQLSHPHREDCQGRQTTKNYTIKPGRNLNSKRNGSNSH